MAELLYRLFRSLLCEDAVVDVIKYIGSGRNLALYILLHLLHIPGWTRLLKDPPVTAMKSSISWQPNI